MLNSKTLNYVTYGALTTSVGGLVEAGHGFFKSQPSDMLKAITMGSEYMFPLVGLITMTNQNVRSLKDFLPVAIEFLSVVATNMIGLVLHGTLGLDAGIALFIAGVLMVIGATVIDCLSAQPARMAPPAGPR